MLMIAHLLFSPLLLLLWLPFSSSQTQNVTLDDSSPSIYYSGNWTSGTSPSFYDSTYHYTTEDEATASFNFTGIGLSFYPVTNQDGGLILVQITDPSDVNGLAEYHLTSSPEAQSNDSVQTSLNLYSLDDTIHQVTITNLGNTELIIDFITLIVPSNDTLTSISPGSSSSTSQSSSTPKTSPTVKIWLAIFGSIAVLFIILSIVGCVRSRYRRRRVGYNSGNQSSRSSLIAAVNENRGEGIALGMPMRDRLGQRMSTEWPPPPIYEGDNVPERSASGAETVSILPREESETADVTHGQSRAEELPPYSKDV